MNYASLGSISSGTLRTEDLLSAFADALEDCVQVNADAWCSDAGRAQRDAYCALIGSARDCFDEDGEEIDAEKQDSAEDLVQALSDALQDFAPDYVYFGAHPGDGADFGYWLSEDWQQQAEDDGCLMVSDTSEVPDDFAGGLIVCVNDHGNATLYEQDLTGQRVEVWSCV